MTATPLVFLHRLRIPKLEDYHTSLSASVVMGEHLMSEERSNVVEQLEDFVMQIESMQGDLAELREGRRTVALALTKLDEARLWLNEAIVTEK